MGNSTVSNLIKLIFTITVSCSGEENALMHHDHNLFLCLLWYFPESSSCAETLLMLNAQQPWFRIHFKTQRADIWEILTAFVQHLSHQIQKYCKQPCILRQRTLSLSANPQLGVWLPVTLMNVKKDSPRGGWAMPLGYELWGWQTALPTASLSAPQGRQSTSVGSCGWGQTH